MSSRSGDEDSHPGGVFILDRKLRDIVFVLIFITFWVAMVVNSSLGFYQGEPSRLTFGLDYEGNVCGDKYAHPNLHGLDLTYWLNPNQVYLSGLKNSEFGLLNARSICLLDCPIPSEDGLNWVCDYPEGDINLSMNDWIDRNYDYFEFLNSEMRSSSLQLQGPCYPVIYPSVNVYWRCQLIARASNISFRNWHQMGGVAIKDGIIVDRSIYRSINAWSSVFKRYLADVGKAWPVLIVCGWLLPLFLSLIWLLLIQHLVAAMPWITISLFNILIIAVTMFCYLKAGWIGNNAITPIIGEHDLYFHISGREINHLHSLSIIMTVIMVFSILTSVAIVRRIPKASSLLKVAAYVIREVEALIIFPVIPYAILGVFYLFWFSAVLHLFSSGFIIQNDCNANCCAYDLSSKRVHCDLCCGYTFNYTPHITVAIFFHIFGCYWATQFFLASSSTVIAGSVASHYWVGDILPNSPFLLVFSSMMRLVKYNIGSVALGSLVVSFVESIHIILESLRHKLKVVDCTRGGWFCKMAHHSSQLLLKSIEWTLRSVNRSAYIMIAVTGKNFCVASAIATELIVNNVVRVGRLNVIGDVVLFFGKLCVSLSSAAFAFLMLDMQKYRSAHNRVSSPLFPVLVCWALGFVVASLFFSVVEMAIDTYILSFCQDSDEHHGTAQYAPPLLLESFRERNEGQSLTH